MGRRGDGPGFSFREPVMPVLAWRKKWVGGAEDQHGFSAAGKVTGRGNE